MVQLSDLLTPDMHTYLLTALQEHRSILISGGTARGKTHFVQQLADLIDQSERIVSVEESPEIDLAHHEEAVQLQTTLYPNPQQIALPWLLRQAVRMRPDWIILGEIRGAEAATSLKLLEAARKDHSFCGMLATIHAMDPHKALTKLMYLACMNDPNLQEHTARQMTYDNIGCVVQVNRRYTPEAQTFDISIHELLTRPTDMPAGLVSGGNVHAHTHPLLLRYTHTVTVPAKS